MQVTVQRDPGSPGLRERIVESLKRVFHHKIPDSDLPSLVEELFSDLEKTDRATMVRLSSETAVRFSPASAFLYEATKDDTQERNTANRRR